MVVIEIATINIFTKLIFSFLCTLSFEMYVDKKFNNHLLFSCRWVLHLILLFLFSLDDQYGHCFSILRSCRCGIIFTRFSCVLHSHKCGIIFKRFLTFIRWRKSIMLKISFLCMYTPTRTCVLVSNRFYKTMSL